MTISEAARHLASLFNEPVTAADVLRLGLDGHLTLSVDFIGHAHAYLGGVVPYRDAPRIELPRNDAERMPGSGAMTVVDGVLLDHGETITEDTQFAHFRREPSRIDGVWDLAMIGGERLDIEHRFQQETDGPSVTKANVEGTFVKRSDREWARLLEHFSDTVVDASTGKAISTERYHPAGRLPDNAVLVVRTQALVGFETRMNAGERLSSRGASHVSTRERDTLLKLVIGMAIEGYRYDPVASRNEAPAEIAGDLAKQGIEVTDDTVRKWLKEAANTVLATRPRKH